MDDDLQILEAELRRLRPVTPTPRLIHRIEGDLAAAGVARRMPWFRGIAVPAAALLAVMIALMVQPWRKPVPPAEAADGRSETATARAEPVFKPVAMENVLYSAQDEGIVTLADGTPARRERLHYLDTITWRNPRTNASLQWTVPREEVRVVPVSFQ